ncbi:Pro-Pol poly, partial [Paramuricea clavata]
IAKFLFLSSHEQILGLEILTRSMILMGPADDLNGAVENLSASSGIRSVVLVMPHQKSVSFDIIYRPGKDNIPPGTLSRATCATTTQDSLHKLHESLCHPGVTRLYHFVRTKNLPYSLDEIKKVTSSCRVCCECKPQFHQPQKVPLIKATRPFERINIDFKGPLPTINENKYFLNVIDEYSRFPFVFPCPDVSTTTVIICLVTLFSLFGMPAYVHSDRGAAFMSHELRAFLAEKGIATSRTTN